MGQAAKAKKPEIKSQDLEQHLPLIIQMHEAGYSDEDIASYLGDVEGVPVAKRLINSFRRRMLASIKIGMVQVDTSKKMFKETHIKRLKLKANRSAIRTIQEEKPFETTERGQVLIDKIMAETGLNRAEAMGMFDTVLKVMRAGIANEEVLSLTGFGVFRVKEHGASVDKKHVSFKASKILKDRVAKAK